MKLIIVVTIKGDLPEDVPYDCLDAVTETLVELGVEVEDINFQIKQ